MSTETPTYADLRAACLALAKAREQIDTARQAARAWEEQHKEIVTTYDALSGAVVDAMADATSAESNVKDLARQLYEATGNKAPAAGVTIRVQDSIKINDSRQDVDLLPAIFHLTGPSQFVKLVTLNAAAFKRWWTEAGKPPIYGVAEVREPVVAVSKSLDAAAYERE